MIIPCLDAHVLEISAHVSLKGATKGSFRGKKTENVYFWGYFSKAKTVDYD